MDQQTHENNPTIMITSPDRGHQAECPLILPSAASTPITNEDNSKQVLKKEDSLPVTIEEVSIPQPETTGLCSKDQCVWNINRYKRYSCF